MADLLRMRKLTVRVGEREFPFAVEVAVPDGGFACDPGAIDAWHHYNGIRSVAGNIALLASRSSGVAVLTAWRLQRPFGSVSAAKYCR